MSLNPKKIRKAVFPVAGLGTRFLPATKAMPKELMPIVNKPLIQYVVEEAIDAGIKELIFITRSGKEAIENHFDLNFELEHLLESSGKKKILKSIKKVIPEDIKISSVRQERALGLGHAILCAEHLVGDQPFAVLLPDEFLLSEGNKSDFNNMINLFEKKQMGQILVEKIPLKNSMHYGIVDLGTKRISKSSPQVIHKLLEKPNPAKSPSNLRVVGRYILPNEVMKELKKAKPGKDKEIQLTDSIDNCIKKKNLGFSAFLTDSLIFDCGSKKGFLGANIALAKHDSEMKKYMTEVLKK